MSKQPDHEDRADLSPEVAQDEAWRMLAQSMREQSDAQVEASREAGMTGEAGLAKLLAQIEDSDTQAAPASPASTAQAPRADGAPWWMVRTQAVAIVALAASLAVVALWLPTVQQAPGGVGQNPVYEVYADRAGETPSPQLTVVFTPETSLAQMQTLLEAVDGRIAASNSRVGAFGVVLRDPQAGAVSEALQTLRADAQVLMAERVDGQGASEQTHE